jgi:hypothetical protein
MLRRPSPLWTADTSKPGPSSLTSRRSVPFPAVRHAAIRALGPACLIAFCSASRQQ